MTEIKKEFFMKRFASDNCATVHPEVMRLISERNTGHVHSYGEDEYCPIIAERIARLCGGNNAYFVLSGTGANVTALNAMCPTWGAVVCTDLAHINCDETGAPEHLTGAKLYALRGEGNNKLTPEIVEKGVGYMIGVQHHNQPKVISITQSTEVGTVYTPAEVRVLADYAHERGMMLHMDGARFANAVESLGCTAKELTADAGVDALSFGLSKNGGMFGEAVVTFAKLDHFPYVRKSCAQLVSKSRFIAAQFEAMLDNGLWLECAAKANRMAKRLSEGMCKIDGVTCAWPTQANEVFLKLPHGVIEPLREKFDFYDADEGVDTIRLVASWDTTENEVDAFIAAAKEMIAKL